MNNDLISRSELKKVIETYRSNECFNDLQRGKNKMVDYCLSEIDNAPTVEPFERIGAICNENCGYNPQAQGKLANEVLELYEKYQPRLATNVIEFGDALKELLGKYQKGGAE